MGYNDIYVEFKCDSCGTPFRWAPKKLWEARRRLDCTQCKDEVFNSDTGESRIVPHSIRMPAPPLPNVPSALYIGLEKLKRIKLTPLPKEQIVYDKQYCDFFSNQIPEEIQPYSIRSFLIQLSLRDDFPCKYHARVDSKDAWGNVNWNEGCMKADDDAYHPCHLANGWIHGQESCEGWEYIVKNFCQSGNEARFLHQYLRINKDRESPMPIPQAHVEVTEKVRVDFVMFVPITRFDWKWLAIEIDSPMYHEDAEKEFERSMTIASQGYEVLRLSAEKNMLDQVRDLYQKIQAIQEAGTGKVKSVRKNFYSV